MQGVELELVAALPFSPLMGESCLLACVEHKGIDMD